MGIKKNIYIYTYTKKYTRILLYTKRSTNYSLSNKTKGIIEFYMSVYFFQQLIFV